MSWLKVSGKKDPDAKQYREKRSKFSSINHWFDGESSDYSVVTIFFTRLEIQETNITYLYMT